MIRASNAITVCRGGFQTRPYSGLQTRPYSGLQTRPYAKARAGYQVFLNSDQTSRKLSCVESAIHSKATDSAHRT
jgi:hypothetical protein